MSYYGVHNSDVDYMVCSDCQTETFTWMAEVFACPTCGGNKYVFPIFAGETTQQHLADGEDGNSVAIRARGKQLGPSEEGSKKRKRTLSDEKLVRK